MTSMNFRKRLLASGSALQVLTLVGAGAAATAVAVAPAHAQDFTLVNATGRVTDATGNGISGATVTVTSEDQGFSRTATTGADGAYRISSLPQGNYTFTVTAPDFTTYSEKGVALSQSAAGNTFQLVSAGSSPAASGNEIVVTGTRVRVSDFDRATVGAVVNVADVAARVPVSRNLTSVVLLAPGTTAGDTTFGNLPAISGGSVSENAYFLNGLNITDFRKGLGSVEVPFVFYNTVEVKNGGVPAEFGRFTGGFVNAISKAGSNELHASALVTWVPTGSASNVPNTLIDYNAADRSGSVESVFTLSGPIIKDHVFFYGFYQSNFRTNDYIQTSSNPNTVVGGVAVAPYATGSQAYRTTYRKPYWGGKIDILPFENQRLEFTYFDSSQKTHYDNFKVVDQAGGTYDSRTDTSAQMGAYQSSFDILDGGKNYIGRYTGTFFDILTLSAAYGKSENRDSTVSTQPDYPFITDTSGFFSPALTGNPVNVQDINNDTRKFYRADAELYVNLFGEHHFKGGYDREELSSNAISNYTGNRAITYVNSGPSGDTYLKTPNTLYVTQRTFINGGIFTSKNEAFYLQDSWSLFDKRLTLNLGVRDDRFQNANAAGEVFYDSGDNFAPRLAFTSDILGDGSTKVYGSFGRYYLPIPSNTNIRQAGSELDYTRYNLVAGRNPDNTPIVGAPILGFSGAETCPDSSVANCEVIRDGTPTPTIATVAKNLTNQSVDEFVLGAERNLGGRMRVGVYGVYRKLNESLEDIAVDKAVNDYCTAQKISGCDALWTGFDQYVLTNPGAPATITLAFPINGEKSLRTVDFTAAQLGYPQAKRKYLALTGTVDRDWDGVWDFHASYTWSSSKGNIEGGIRSDNGQEDSGITTAFDQPGLTDGTYGYLPGHARHAIKAYGSYQVTPWFLFGLQGQAISPRKFGCIGRVPTSRDAFAGAYGAAGFYCNVDSSGKVITDPAFTGFSNTATNTSLKLTPRGSQLESDWNIFVNASATFTIPSDDVKARLRVDVFNIFNRQGVTDLRELGTQASGRPRGDYGSPLAYQAPRSVRLSFGVDF